MATADYNYWNYTARVNRISPSVTSLIDTSSSANPNISDIETRH
jgi:hypothetical protein